MSRRSVELERKIAQYRRKHEGATVQDALGAVDIHPPAKRKHLKRSRRSTDHSFATIQVHPSIRP